MGRRRFDRDYFWNLFIFLFLILFASGAIPGAMSVHPVRQKIEVAGFGLFWFGLALTFLPLVLRISGDWIYNVAAICMVAGLVITLGTWISDPVTLQSAQISYKRTFDRFGIFASFAGVLILSLVGCILYWMKSTKLSLYAWMEITFALTSCYVAVERSREGLGLSTFTVLVGAVYLVVRGLDNRRKALDDLRNNRSSIQGQSV
jgi:hypothetical protein